MTKTQIWEKRLAEQERRGLTNKALARIYGVTHHTVAYWRIKLLSPGRKVVVPSVVEISGGWPQSVSGHAVEQPVEVEFRGARIRLPVGTSEEGLNRILRAIAVAS